MAVTSETLRLENELRTALDAILDAQTRDLVRGWATAWDEVEADLRTVLLEMLVAGENVARAQLLRSARLRKALALIADRLDDLARTSQVRILRDLAAVIDAAGGAQASIIDSQLPPQAAQLVELDAWSRVDARQVDAIVRRTTQQITALHRPLSAEAYAAVRRELIRGVAAGSNPRAVAGRMVARAEGQFNGGLQRALVISRTETLDAHRAAAQVGQAQHADVLAGWTWLAKLDSRTCPSCWAQHGQLHPLDEAGPHDHQQGRCARMPQTKSWAELGIEGVQEPASLLPNAADAFTALPVADQRSVLGPKRYAAYAAGQFPMGSWSQRRLTDGWRDSFVVAPAPSQSGGRRGSRAALAS